MKALKLTEHILKGAPFLFQTLSLLFLSRFLQGENVFVKDFKTSSFIFMYYVIKKKASKGMRVRSDM